MNLRKQFGKSIAALLLFVALMLPTAIQFFHLLEGHEHVACNNFSTHIHKSIEKCETCTFHLSSLNYDIAEYPDLLAPTIPVKINQDFSSLLLHSFKITNTQLRAPPIFS